MDRIAAPQRLRRAFGQRDETRLAFLHQLRHPADAFFDRNVGIDTRHAEHVERVDAEIAQALLAALTQIARVAAAAHGIGAALARAAALGMNDDVASAAADRLADQPMIVTLAIARRGVEEVDTAIERKPNGGDRLSVVGGSIDARHAV